ncbi:MAG: Ig-like domain-containing protein, partial [bacterium]|nr:Ig-like domain-containing protein [bacterium]
IVQPTIDASGNLTFQTIQDYNSSMGEIIVTTFAEDDGPGDAPNMNRTETKTFTINVAPINDPPSFTLTQSEVVVSEDQEEIDGTARTEIPGFATNLAVGPPTATDEVGQTLSFSLFSNAPELFEEQPAIDANGNLTFKTAKDRAGTAIVEAQLIDSGLGTPPPNDNTSQTATFTITITPVNDAPEFTVPAGLSVQEDAGNVTRPNFATGIRPGPASATDESGQLVRFEVEALNQASFAVQPSMSPDGTLTFRTATHANSANADFGVRVRLIDDGPGNSPNVNTSEYQTFTITVNPVNDAPVPNGYETQGVEDSELVIQAADILDGDLPGPTPDETEGLIITQVEPVTAAGGTIVPVFNGNELVSLTYNPSRDFVGTDTFRYVVTDLGSPRMSATGTVTITVEGINDPPQFTIGSNRVVDEDFGPISFTGWARDILAGPPSALDELASQTVSFQVTAMNPSLFAVQPTVDGNGRLSFETALDANGSTEVVVVAVDDGSDVPPNINSSAAQTFTITVRPINDAPVFTAGADVSVDEDSGAYSAGWATNIAPAGGLLSNPPTATDEASQSISFTVSVDRPELFQQQPTIASNGTLSFTPAQDALGVAVLTITAVDNGPVGGSNVNTSTTETLTITIRGVNDAPVAVNDGYNTNENVVLGIGAPGLLVNDTDVDLPDDALSAIPVTTTSELGAVVVISADGSFSYDPTKVDAIQRLTDGQSVSDSFQYQIRDLAGALSNFATVTINVAGIDDPPVAVDDTYSVGIGQALSLDVLANDFDIDSTIDRTSIEVVTLPIFGTFDVQPDGTILYTASPGSRGVDVLGYTVKDAAGNVSNEASVTITINNAPVAVDDSAFTVKNAPVDINVLANDSDVDGFLDPSTVTVVVAPSPSGTAEVLANGQIRFTPSAGFSGQARFSYVVSDNVGTVSNLAEVVVRVQNSAWQNPNGTLDVNNDSFVTPIDALLIINYLNGGGEQFLPDSGVTPPPYLDPNGDEFVTPVDALLIINALNRTSGGGSGEGEFDSQLDVMPITPAQMLQMVGPIALQSSSEHAESLRDALREEYLELVAAGESQQLKSENSVSQLAGFQAFDDDSVIDALSCSLHEHESSAIEEAIDSMFSDGWSFGPQLPE